MRLTGEAAWRDIMENKKLYQLTKESFQIEKVFKLNEEGRSEKEFELIVRDTVGICWASGRLKPGDIILCDELSGDCFYRFYLVDYLKYANRNGVEMKLIPYPFGAYAMKAKKLDGLTEKEYHLLRAGEKVEVNIVL